MSYQVLARKWRPGTFAELVGQEHVQRALINALDHDRLHHAFLFTGTRGVGKTTIARILAKSLNCEKGITSTPCGECSACVEIREGRFIDLIEVDAASRTKVDETRELLENVQYTPARGRYKVYLIDEVHMFSNNSFNALLKTLEEPPPHVKFLFATTDPQKLPVTILSRCLQFNLKRLPVEQIVNHLQHILKEEGISAESGALTRLARAADGSMRDALSLLDQAIAFGAGALKESDVRLMLGSIEHRHIIALLQALAANDAAGSLRIIQALNEQALDCSAVLVELLTALHHLAILQSVPDSLPEDTDELESLRVLAAQLSPEAVQLYYQIGLMARRDLPLAPDPRGGLEMALLRMHAFRPLDTARQNPTVPPAQTSKLATSPTAPAQTTPVSLTDSAPSVTASSIPNPVDDWESLVNALGLSGLTQQLAVNSVLEQNTADALVLRLAPAHRQLLSEPRRKSLEAALQSRLNTRATLRIDIGEPRAATPAKQQQQRQLDRQRSAVESIQNDDVVQSMVDTFGATFNPDTIQPVE